MAKPGGKWAYLKGKYPKMPVDAGWLQQVDAILDSPAPAEVLSPGDEGLELTVRCLSDFQLNKLYLKARDRADDLGEELSALETETEAYTRVFVERLSEAGEASKTFDDGVSIGVTVEPYVSVESQADMLKWVKDTGQEAILTVNYQTLASIVKAAIEKAEPLPLGVKVFLKDKLSCRGRNKRAKAGEATATEAAQGEF